MLCCRGARFMDAPCWRYGRQHAAAGRLVEEQFRAWAAARPSCSVLSPVTGPLAGLLPALVERFAPRLVAGRLEDAFDAGLAAQFVEAAPEARRKAGQIGGAKGRG